MFVFGFNLDICGFLYYACGWLVDLTLYAIYEYEFSG